MVSALFKASEAGDVEQVREVLKECSSIDIETKGEYFLLLPLSAIFLGGWREEGHASKKGERREGREEIVEVDFFES